VPFIVPLVQNQVVDVGNKIYKFWVTKRAAKYLQKWCEYSFNLSFQIKEIDQINICRFLKLWL
jgi:hypothetical protein